MFLTVPSMVRPRSASVTAYASDRACAPVLQDTSVITVKKVDARKLCSKKVVCELIATGNPYEATCNSSWSVQRDLWINDYKSWTDAVSRCSPLDPQALNASTAASPVEQWNAMQRDYINSLELWLKIYSRSLGLPATVPIDDNLSLEQQWGSVLTFANKVGLSRRMLL